MKQWPLTLLGLMDVLEVINAAAYATYRRGWRKRERAAVPVISVGNIALGGTGKTPLVAALARVLLTAGARPAILTRGYRRRGKEPVLLWRGREMAWEKAGDEPVLLARALPEVAIVVDADRVRGAATAVRQAGATHLLLDDGFQHWRLERDLDIVAVEASDPFGALAPRREHPDALARADAIVLSRASNRTEALAAIAVLGSYAPRATFVATRLAARALHWQGQRQAVDVLKGKPVLAMAGIASPEGFIHSLGDFDANIIEMKLFGDHHRYTRREVEMALAQAEAAGALLVTTAKDVVKLPPDLAGRVAWLEVEAVPFLGSFEEILKPILPVATVESPT